MTSVHPTNQRKRMQKIMLHVDAFHVNRMAHSSVIGHPVHFRSAEPVGACVKEESFEGLDIAIRELDAGGLIVEETRCDKEFKPTMNEVEDKLGVKSSSLNAQDHVPAAECNDGTLKEAFRTASN